MTGAFKALYACLTIHVWALEPSPSQFLIRSWDTQQGLHEEVIGKITQTTDGYLWMATNNGLVRWDGFEFQVYYPNKTIPSASAGVSKLQPAPDGGLWLCSQSGGIIYFKNGRFHSEPGWESVDASDGLLLDHDGTLYAMTRGGVLRLDGKRFVPARIEPAGLTSRVVTMVRDRQGKLWLGLKDGSLIRLSASGQVERWYTKADGMTSEIRHIRFAGDGTVWCGTENGLVCLRKDRVAKYGTAEGLATPMVRALLTARDQSVWIGTSRGLQRLKDGRIQSLGREASLPEDSVNSVFQDREGNIWVSYASTGVHRISVPKFLNWGTREGVAATGLRAVVADSKGRIWMAGGDTAEVLANGRNLTISPPQGRRLRQFEEDSSGRIWALNRTGVYQVDPSTGQLAEVKVDDAGERISLFRSRAGVLWLVASNGLYQWRSGQFQRAPVTGLPRLDGRSFLMESPDGRLWLTTFSQGLFEILATQAVRTTGPLGPIQVSYVDRAGDFWFGLAGGGLIRLRNGKTARFGTAPDDPANHIYQFGEDMRGNFWLGLRAGLLKISKAQLNDYLDGKPVVVARQLYDSSDGLRSINFGLAYQGLAAREPSRILWFGTQKGSVRVDTEEPSSNPVPPAVKIRTISAAGREIAPASQLSVLAGDTVEFGFDAVTLADNSRLKIRHRLEGVDADWSEPSRARTAAYSRLWPGTYEFRVKAQNNDGVWSKDATLQLTVLPRFYQTWWFGVAVAVAATLLVGAFVRSRTWILVRKNKELERRVKERTEQLERARQAAENAAQVKTDFLATMSHEIRTPLHGVLGTVELLSATPLGPQQRQYLDTVRNSSNSLLSLLNDILDLSKLEAGRLELRTAPFSMRRTVEAVAGLLSASALLKQIRFNVSISSELPEHFLGDEARIRQILFNLAGNALKFTDHGSVGIAVTGSRQGPDWEIEICVTDTGIGIPEDQIGHLFQNFFQVDGSATRRHGGTGLGLAICQRLAGLMKGTIDVTSRPGHGSDFRLKLLLSEAFGAKNESANVDGKPVRLEGRVLVVEDNAVNQMLARALLERVGCHVDTATNGRIAVERARATTYDLILMDCQMPEMDGFEATQEIRSLPSPASCVAIVAMTANAMEGDRLRCLAAGMNGYLAKPFQPADLLATLTCFLKPAAAPEQRDVNDDPVRQLSE